MDWVQTVQVCQFLFQAFCALILFSYTHYSDGNTTVELSMKFNGNIVYNFQTEKWSPQPKARKGLCACYRKSLTLVEAYHQNNDLVNFSTLGLAIFLFYAVFRHVKRDQLYKVFFGFNYSILSKLCSQTMCRADHD